MKAEDVLRSYNLGLTMRGEAAIELRSLGYSDENIRKMLDGAYPVVLTKSAHSGGLLYIR